MLMWNKMEQQALTILDRLEAEGFEAYFVGGYVRDKVLDKPVKDIDIATSALPEDVIRLFDRTVPTGLKHGTVTVLVTGEPFEVTTFRKESEYEGFRRPAEVEFISDLQEDLRRRDFTMNAMAMDRSGRVLDPFCGKADLAKGLLRCVGDPHERFHEDALRMMRCIRFASAYSLEVEQNTWAALMERRDLLQHVAMERVKAELDRMMGGRDPYRGWRLLAASGLLGRTKEQLSWWFASPDFSEEALPPEWSALNGLKDSIHRYILIMLHAGLQSDDVDQMLRQLTFSVKDTGRITGVVRLEEWLSDQDWQLTEGAGTVEGTRIRTHADIWKLAAIRYGREALQDWLTIHEAAEPNASGLSTDRRQLAPYISLLLKNGYQWLGEVQVFEAKKLAVSGQELIRAAGKPAGPWVSRTLAALLRETALGRAPNDKQALLDLASSYITEG